MRRQISIADEFRIRRHGYDMPGRPIPTLIKDAEQLPSSQEDRRLLYLHSCQKVFIQRDYTSGLNVRFETIYPPQFIGKISQDTWETTIDRINAIFSSAEQIGWPSIFETMLGCLTCYCSRLVSTTIYEKKMVELDKFIAQQNNDIYLPADLLILNPLERGLRVIEIVQLGTDPNHFDSRNSQARNTSCANGTF